MQEYISRKYLENIVDYYLAHSNGAEHYAYGIVRGEVRIAPSADVKEVIHARWEEYPDRFHLRCTNCRVEFEKIRFPVTKNYCPNCGVKMNLK